VSKHRLSQGEMQTVRVLWELGRASVRDVHQRQAQERPIEFGTVQTYLRRLEKKGYVRSQLQGRVRIYSARRRPDRVIRETVDDMVGRLFGGKTMPLVRHLIQQGDMSVAEIDELRQLVESLEEDERHD